MKALHLAALLVCHNRVNVTLTALNALYLACRISGVLISVVLFDDASTDGTSDAVRAEFPDVRILQGDGSAFWNRGLNAAWRAALPLPVQGFLWLNDDVTIDVDALARTGAYWNEAMARRPDAGFILVGATRSHDDRVTYGGKKRVHTPWALRFADVTPGETLRAVDTFNGNFVVVPRAVVECIGLNDPTFFHNMGDIDYGLRAGRAGTDIWLMPGAMGCCPDNAQKTVTGFPGLGLTIRQRWRKVNTHHGLPFLSWGRLTLRHSGIWFPLHFLLPYRHLIFPGRSVKPDSI